ncbi:MAG: DegV family protein [Lachnospiraceae bacterium]|nr:DegV family protein [Lachnospiraceae bacterium]
MRTAIVTDSNSGITQKMAVDMGVSVIPMPFTIDGELFFEDINLTREEFYQRQADGAKILTSQPSPEEITGRWDALLEKYDDVVHIPMSSGLSGSCQTAIMLAQDYGGRVQVVNNQRISVTMKRSVQDAMEMAEKKGLNAAQIKEVLERVKMESSIYITLDTLKYLKQGGRITPAAAAIGSLLHIKPVLQIKGERLDSFSKARTLTQGKHVMINALRHDIDTLYGGTENGTVWVYAVHAYLPEQFPAYAEEVRKAFPALQVEEDYLSLSVACHIGPGALAIACSKKIDGEY